MIISVDKNVIFVANPKTATTSIQHFIKSIDGSFDANAVVTNGERIVFEEHDTPARIRRRLGEAYDGFLVFVFIRDPYDKAVSSYFFYRNGVPLTKGSVWAYRGNVKNLLGALVTWLNVLLAKILPFSVWSLLRTVRSNSDYLLGDKGQFLVNYIGRVEALEGDLKAILEKLGIGLGGASTVPAINTSKHENPISYFGNRFFKRLFDWKYRKEISMFNELKNKPVDHDFRGGSVRSLEDFGLIGDK